MNDQNNSQEILNLIQNIQSKLNIENNSTDQQMSQETNNATENITYQQNENIINNNNNNSNNTNFDLSSILSMFMKNNNNQSSSQSFDPTILTKFQKIFSNINMDNPKKNLLLSLKPFLRKSRQDKIGEYITMLTIADAIGIFNRKGSDDNV